MCVVSENSGSRMRNRVLKKRSTMSRAQEYGVTGMHGTHEKPLKTCFHSFPDAFCDSGGVRRVVHIYCGWRSVGDLTKGLERI